MKFLSPAFGLISGLGTTYGLLPHVLTLTFLHLSNTPHISLAPLIAFTIIAKIAGEVFFWIMAGSRMNQEENLKQWKKVIKPSLYLHPKIFPSLLIIISDTVVDILLISIALRLSVSPILALLTLLGCQAISSPVQGFISDTTNTKTPLLLTSVVGILTLIIATNTSMNYEYFFGTLSSICSLSNTSKILYTLACKGLLANTATIARAALTRVIKYQTLKLSNN